MTWRTRPQRTHNTPLVVLALSIVSVTCFAPLAQAEDQSNVVKFGEPYRIYMQQVPALILLAGIWAWLRPRKES